MRTSANPPRKWPVDPAKYPLSGPTRGPVYSPSEKLRMARLDLWFIARGLAYYVAASAGIWAMVWGFVALCDTLAR